MGPRRFRQAGGLPVGTRVTRNPGHVSLKGLVPRLPGSMHTNPRKFANPRPRIHESASLRGDQPRSAAASAASRSTRAQSRAATASPGTIQLPPTQPTFGRAR